MSCCMTSDQALNRYVSRTYLPEGNKEGARRQATVTAIPAGKGHCLRSSGVWIGLRRQES